MAVAGTLTVYGQGGANSDSCNGISMAGVLSTVDGVLIATGIGGGSGGDTLNNGINVYTDGSQIRTTGSGNIWVWGTGGNAVSPFGDNLGISISATNGIQATGTGSVNIYGTGGSGAGSGPRNYGVYVTTSVAGTGTPIYVSGTGGASSGNSNQGIFVVGAKNQSENDSEE